MILPPVYGTVESILVPPGWYLITAKTVVIGTVTGTLVQCQLTRSGALQPLDQSEVTLVNPVNEATVALHAATQVTTTGGEHVVLSCQVVYPGIASSLYPQLNALQVGSILQPAP